MWLLLANREGKRVLTGEEDTGMHGRNRDWGKCINTGEDAINMWENEALCCESVF